MIINWIEDEPSKTMHIETNKNSSFIHLNNSLCVIQLFAMTANRRASWMHSLGKL